MSEKMKGQKKQRTQKSPPKLTKTEAVDMLWRRGVLSWKLNSAQKELYEFYQKCDYNIPVFNATRRFGKSYLLLVIAIENCIKNPGFVVHYACPTAVMATKVVIPNMRTILKDCPTDLLPTYYKHDRAFEFPNGSKIQIEGTDDGNADRLRGTSTNLGIVDEAGFVKDLDYLVNDILLPQTLSTKGKLLLSSTPPKSSGHPFVTQFIRKAEKNNAYVKMDMMTVLSLIEKDPPALQHIDRRMVETLKETSGGENSPTWRREYMVEIVTDTAFGVIPEFTEEIKKEIVREWERPSHYDVYVSMDPGLIDFTCVLFGYYDFQNAKLVIEYEYLGRGNEITTETIANVVKNTEVLLTSSNDGIKHNIMRISDNDPILLNDLISLHGLNFIPTRKDEKEAAINDLRMKISQKKIIINPRCVNLIYQLQTTVWNKRRTSYERSDEGGHGDAIDALLYMTRNVLWNKNPYPNNGINYNTQFSSMRNDSYLSPTQLAFKNMFIKKK